MELIGSGVFFYGTPADSSTPLLALTGADASVLELDRRSAFADTPHHFTFLLRAATETLSAFSPAVEFMRDLSVRFEILYIELDRVPLG